MFISVTVSVGGGYQVNSAPIYSQIGTCHGQFGTSIRNNLVIIKYLYKNKNKKVGFNS